MNNNFSKKDLKSNRRVELNNGDFYIVVVTDEGAGIFNDKEWYNLESYNKNLTFKEISNNSLDIKRIFDKPFLKYALDCSCMGGLLF